MSSDGHDENVTNKNVGNAQNVENCDDESPIEAHIDIYDPCNWPDKIDLVIPPDDN